MLSSLHEVLAWMDAANIDAASANEFALKMPVTDTLGQYLMLAITNGYDNVAEAIITLNPQMANDSDAMRWTPFHYAIASSNQRLITFLIPRTSTDILKQFLPPNQVFANRIPDDALQMIRDQVGAFKESEAHLLGDGDS